MVKMLSSLVGIAPRRSALTLHTILVSFLSTSWIHAFRSSFLHFPSSSYNRHHPRVVATGAAYSATRNSRFALFGSNIDRSMTTTTKTKAPELVVSLRDCFQATDDSNSADNTQMIRLILASQSPRRKEILDMMGLQGKFEVMPSPLDESAMQKELQHLLDNPVEYTRMLAEQKAMAVAERLQLLSSAQSSAAVPATTTTTTTTLILGSDTIVSFGGDILEKPVDKADAVRMLTQLQGNRHSVHTGVSLVRVVVSFGDGISTSSCVHLVESFTDTATVQFAALTETDISAYVATGEPMDKAGSYGIQGIGGQIVSSIEGDFFTVMGLPMHKTSRALANAVSGSLCCQ